MLTGSCLCGRIRYEIRGKIGPDAQCHCVTCRKAQGGPFVTNAPVRVKYFHLVSSSESVAEFESSPGKKRYFCRGCGSPLWMTFPKRSEGARSWKPERQLRGRALSNLIR